jgi:putative ABC transport system ATP-binding protein
MSYQMNVESRTLPELFWYFGKILGPEKKFYLTAIVYGVGISLLSLATPVSVQMLVNTIVNTGLTTPLVVLSLTLFALLLIAVGLNAMRIYIVDVFGRRFYARMVSEIALRATYALNPYFEDDGKSPLFNRYFDILIVMKRVPYLLVGGFSIVLQAIFGFILVSMYHPFFLIFNMTIVLLIWLTWRIWGRPAINSALELSHKKHAAAAWIEGLGASNGYFKTRGHIHTAMEQTDRVTADYMNKHIAHFRNHFAQTVCFLLIYAAASAALLGLGGWLVIQGELSIGQLVAAELVLSVVFYGLSQSGTYLTYFYDLCAAVEELSFFYDIEQEEVVGEDEPISGDSALKFVEARGDAAGISASLSFEVPSGARVLAQPQHYAIQRICTNLLKRHDDPAGGYISLGGTDIHWVKPHILRREVIVLDRPSSIQGTIQEFLRMSSDTATGEDVMAALRTVGLDRTLSRLKKGLHTSLARTGWPLSIPEVMELQLAAAMIARPKVLVLNQLYDVMLEASLQRSLDALQEQAGTTVIYFSNRRSEVGASHFLYMGAEEQHFCPSLDQLWQMSASHSTDNLPPAPASPGAADEPAIRGLSNA